MDVTAALGSPNETSDQVLVVSSFAGEALSGGVQQLDSAADGYFSKLQADGALPVKLGKASLFHRVPGLSADCVVVSGAGDASEFGPWAATQWAGTAAKLLAADEHRQVGWHVEDFTSTNLTQAVAAAINGCHGQDLLRAKKNLHPFQSMHWFTEDTEAVRRGHILADGLLLARELVNLPANLMYPESFARRAAEVAVATGQELEVWDELRLRREGCGALLAVAAASARPPRLLILRHRGSAQRAPLALVGKGVTFDSGGLSLKPSDGMLDMKCDMAGAATVLAAMQVIARLDIERPVIGVVGLVENMISGHAFKLGDVLTARSGKTIEIHNTDAEGRLVLADALDVCQDEQPEQIIDLATLTGACVVALGTDVAGLMSNNQILEDQLRRCADAVGEQVWPLPMHAHFGEQIQSQVADIKNMGAGRWGGAITAAKFLEEFVRETPWTHIDMAGPAFSDKAKPHLDAGATGALVRTLVEFAGQG